MLAIYAAFLQLPYTTSDAAITRTIPEEDLPDQEMGRSVAPRRSSRDNRDSKLDGHHLNGHLGGRPVEPQASRHHSGRKAPRRRGGLLRRLFMFDVCVFAIFVGLAIAPYLYRCRDGRCDKAEGGEGEEWWGGGGEGGDGEHKAAMRAALVRTVLVWMKTFYAVCSLPFALFMLPLANIFLHNAMPTAYDQYGRCCPYQYPSAIDAKVDAARAKVGAFSHSASRRFVALGANVADRAGSIWDRAHGTNVADRALV